MTNVAAYSPSHSFVVGAVKSLRYFTLPRILPNNAAEFNTVAYLKVELFNNFLWKFDSK